MKSKMRKLFCLFIFILMVFQGNNVFAQDSSSDKDQTSTSQDQPSTLTSVYPYLNPHVAVANAAKYPLNQTVVYMEKKHIYEKVHHVYMKCNEYGFYPGFFDINSPNCPDDGVSFRHGIYQTSDGRSFLGSKYEKLFLDGDLAASLWGRYSAGSGNADVGSRLALSNIAGVDGLYSALTGRYQIAPEEEFYGIGNRHSVNNDYTFTVEESSLDYVLGKEDILPGFDLENGVGVSNLNIQDGSREGLRQLNAFEGDRGEHVVGTDGSDIFSYGSALIHDTRDDKRNPTDGGYEKVSFAMNHGFNEPEEEFAYWKLRGEVTRYFPLHKYFNWRADKVFVLHTVYERNQDVNHSSLPFFDMARLDRSTVRGYLANRFFDKEMVASTAEYRYTIWKWKDYKVNSSLFYDFGMVFPEGSKVSMRNLRNGYGVAFSFIFPNARTLSLGFARCDEGYDVYLKWKPEF